MHRELTGESVATPILNKTEHLENGLFNIVVLGEVKKGKSSFINALLGVQNLVPVDTDISTSCVYRISYGEELSYTVHFFKPLSENELAKAPLKIEACEVAAYGTENGNPENRKQVDYIDITCPSAFLRGGFCLIDTPGLGGMYKAHRAITYRYVPQADAVFFVTDHMAPIGSLECSCIKDVLEVTPHLYFVQTKAFALSATDAEVRKQNNINIICNKFPSYAQACNYFLTDCKDIFTPGADEYDLEDSGYPKIQAFCRDTLMSGKKDICTKQLGNLWLPVLQRCRMMLSEKNNILNTDSQEELNALMTRAQQAQNDFKEWKLNTRKNYLIPLKSLLDSSYQNALKDCSSLGIGSELHSKLCDTINSCLNMQAIRSLLNGTESGTPFKDKILSSIISSSRSIISGYIRAVSRGVSELTNSVTGAQITGNGESLADSRISNILNTMNQGIQESNTYDRVRNGTMGVGVGATVGGFIGSIAGSILPGVGNVVGGYVGSAIGAWFGGSQGIDSLNQQDVRRAQQSLINSLNSVFSVATQELNRTITSMHSRIATDSQECVEAYINNEEASLNQTAQQLQNRAKISSAELNAAKNNLAIQKIAYNNIFASLNLIPNSASA